MYKLSVASQRGGLRWTCPPQFSQTLIFQFFEIRHNIQGGASLDFQPKRNEPTFPPILCVGENHPSITIIVVTSQKFSCKNMVFHSCIQ